MAPAHPYIPNSAEASKRKLLEGLGISGPEELYRDIPLAVRLRRPLRLPGPLPEQEVAKKVEEMLSGVRTALDMPVFLGAGCWPHYVPAAVDFIVARTEFYTSYTPYQAEVSQGMLQALWEYQSLICELTAMEVANCSLYDWASALGEAARMAVRATGRRRVLIPKIIHPERLEVLRAYAEPVGIRVEQVSYEPETGQMDLEDLKAKMGPDVAAIYVENPSYLGFIEARARAIGEVAHDQGALFIVGVDPISLGILEAPGNYGADIVVGEGQPLGNPMNFGGPLLGLMACRADRRLIWQMPGRIIGLTVDAEGRKAFCMALQAREQHIRREKASSNICTNEALCAVAAAAYLALLGPEGLRELCETIIYRSQYAMRELDGLPGIRAPLFKSFHFKEFTVNYDGAGLTAKEVHDALLRDGIHGGKPISGEFPELGQSALYCITEVHTKEDIDRLVAALRALVEG
ncbi:aminomethyl-transferring glycine dehydrogenase subunit GcvPA [Candidatus Bathyarchaeota archaeon]|nr:MAG: aminomethyl-transferring glycine dehydrogenase subunit GcvPA [Candidatus Bathyarchaeota archaeon]